MTAPGAETSPAGRQRFSGFLDLVSRAVGDGDEIPSAIEQAAIHRPDIVLLDIGMPGFDGYEVARRMRTELGLKSTLVALTGYGEARHRRQSREAGFDEHVTKPVDIRKLETLLKLPN